jgi:hypothetical protein
MKAVGCKANERSQRGRPRNTSECGGEDGLKVDFFSNPTTHVQPGEMLDLCSRAVCAGGGRTSTKGIERGWRLAVQGNWGGSNVGG